MDRPALSDQPLDLTALYPRYQGRLFALAYHLMGNRAEAEDIAQDTWVRALTHAVPPGYTWPWLAAICYNLVRDRGRKAALRHEIPWEPGHDTGADCVTPERLWLTREGVQTIQAQWAGLPPPMQAALWRRVAGQDVRTIAAALGLTVPATKSLLFRARRAAQAALALDTAALSR